jgi:hypothetical protein
MSKAYEAIQKAAGNEPGAQQAPQEPQTPPVDTPPGDAPEQK